MTGITTFAAWRGENTWAETPHFSGRVRADFFKSAE